MKIIWHWLILSIALVATTYILPGKVAFAPLYSALVVGACLMFLNLTIKPIISILTLPINILTLGIFGILLNGAILWFLTFIIRSFHIASFTEAIIAGIIIAVINWILERLLK